MKKIIICLMAINQCYLVTAQSIGIGTTTPSSSAALHVSSTTKGLLIPSMTTTQRNAIVSPAEGLLIYNTSTNELNQRQSGGWKIIINNDAWTGGGSGQLFNIGDNVGINTAGPSERLDVSGNIRSNSSMIIDNATAILQLKNAGVNTGFVQLSGDNLRVGTNSGNPTGDVIIRMDGTDMVSFQKTASAGTTMQMNLNGVSTGVLQTTSTGNVSLTAVNANAQVQLGGEVFINNTASRTGIGTSAPSERLHVNGNMLATGNANITGNLNVTGFVENKLTAANTGSAYHLLPICYGRVNANGTKAGGTPNFISARSGGTIDNGDYYISCAQITSSSIIIINCKGDINGDLPHATYSINGTGFNIHTTNGNSFVDCAFNFIIFDP